MLALRVVIVVLSRQDTRLLQRSQAMYNRSNPDLQPTTTLSSVFTSLLTSVPNVLPTHHPPHSQNPPTSTSLPSFNGR